MTRVLQFGLLCASLASAQIPQNLDFRADEPGQPPIGWSLEKTTAEVQHEDCGVAPACARMTGGQIRQTIPAALYRDKPVRLTAWLRNGAQLWLRVNRPNQPAGLFDQHADVPVRAPEWTKSEISLVVAPDAQSIDFGVKALGANPAGVRDVMFDVLNVLPLVPHNLDFAEGEPDQPPSDWDAAADGDKFEALTIRKDCRTGPSCAVLTGAGSLIETMNAAAYMGKKVRLRAWVKLEPSGSADVAHMFMRDETRDIHGTDWTAYEITHFIDSSSAAISFGFSLAGAGKAWIDNVRFEVIPDEKPASGSISGSTSSSLSSLPSVSSSLSALAPSIEEVRRIVNDAAGKALAWSGQLPNFLCTETIRRSQKRNNGDWKADDVLTVQLGSADGKEYAKLVAVNNKPAKVGYDAMKGVTTEGEFGGAIAEVFRPGAANFSWDSDSTLRGRPVRVIRYNVDVDKSTFELKFPETSWQQVVGHHGLIYVDRETGEVLRLVQIALVPPDAPLRADSTTIDYDHADIGGTKYLLPLSAEVTLAANGAQFHNEIEFHDYRKFTADSSLSFQ